MSTWICGVLLAQVELCDGSAVRSRGPAAIDGGEVRGMHHKDEDEGSILGSALRPSGPAMDPGRLDRPDKVEVTAMGVRCVVQFVEVENAIAAEWRGVAYKEMISERALQFAQRVDRYSKSPIGVGQELRAGRADRTQPEVDIGSLRFL